MANPKRGPTDTSDVQAAADQFERGAAVPAPPKAPEAEDDDPPTGPVLLFNARGGFYQATAMRALPKTLSDSQQRYEPTFLRLPPGLMLIHDLELWKRVRSCAGLQRRIDDGEIQLLEGSRSIRPHDTWRRLKPKQAIERIKATADVQTLRDLLELDERPEVIAALEEQIAECTSDGEQRQQQRQAQRRIQRAHHRAATRRGVSN